MGARVLEIGAGRKGAACLVAGQHGKPDTGIGGHLVAMSRNLLVEILTPGVARLGSAQGEPADVATFFIENRHRKLLRAKPLSGADIALWPRMIASTILRM